MKKDTEQTFNTIPHRIKEAFYAGTISVPEKNILLHLRMIADPYGSAKITAGEIQSDVFNNKIAIGTVNKHLSSLREKKWIAYRDRQGRGSAFKIQLDVWLLSESKWSYIQDSLNRTNIGSTQTSTSLGASEVNEEDRVNNRKYEGQKKVEDSSQNRNRNRLNIGSDYTDTDKDINTDSYSSFDKQKDILVEDFKPHSSSEERLFLIAQAVGELSMGFVIGKYRDHDEHGIEVMEKIVSQMNNMRGIENRPAYFNKAVENQLK